jgi:hypothetical protein
VVVLSKEKGKKMKAIRKTLIFFLAIIVATLACSFGGDTVEEEAPVVVIALPEEGDSVAVGQIVNVVATVTSSSGVDKVELLVNGQLVSTEEVADAPASLSLNIEWVPVVEGAVVLAVVGYDVDGNASEPALVTVHVVTAVSEGSGGESVPATQAPEQAQETVMCTPPPCGANEAYFCPGSCPGGCGITCATFTPTPPPPDTPTYTPHPPTPTFTFTPTNTSEFVLVPVISLQVLQLATVERITQQVTIPSGGIDSATATCPANSVVVSGGYASDSSMLVYTQVKSGNGWQVYAKNNSGSSELLNAYALCLKNSNGSTSQVYTSNSIAGGSSGYTEVSCPSGTIVTGGGFASKSNGDLIVYNTSKSGNGWRVYAKNISGSSLSLNSYAVCLSDLNATTSVVYVQESVLVGGWNYAEAICTEGDLIVGGGFAAQTTFRMYNSSPTYGYTDRWISYARNNGSSELKFNTYAVCLSFD